MHVVHDRDCMRLSTHRPVAPGIVLIKRRKLKIL